MEKYTDIAEITDEFLSGKLKKLTMQYISQKKMKVSVLYEDAYDYFYDYDLEIDAENKKFRFLGHKGLNSIFRLSLEREVGFEQAVFDYLSALT